MGSSGSDWLARARGVSPDEATLRGVSALIMAFFAAIIGIVSELENGIRGLIQTLSAVRDLFITLLTEPTVILEMTARFTAFELTAGSWSFFGPFTLAVGVGSIAVAFWVWAVFDPPIPLPGFLGRIVNRDRDDD